MKVREVKRKLEDAGWVYDRTNGGHHIYKKEGVAEQVSLPGHDRDEVDKGTLAQIRRKSGVKL